MFFHSKFTINLKRLMSSPQIIQRCQLPSMPNHLHYCWTYSTTYLLWVYLACCSNSSRYLSLGQSCKGVGTRRQNMFWFNLMIFLFTTQNQHLSMLLSSWVNLNPECLPKRQVHTPPHHCPCITGLDFPIPSIPTPSFPSCLLQHWLQFFLFILNLSYLVLPISPHF